jgi:hypothetical protein
VIRNANEGTGISLTYLAGTILGSKTQQLQRLLFRLSRGKVLCFFDQESFKLTDLDGVERLRTVFVLIFEGNEYLKEKVSKICAGVDCSIYSLPEHGKTGPEMFN